MVAWGGGRGGGHVRWGGSGAEGFVADNEGRDHLTHAELALDGDGHFLALKVETLANLGAYVSTFGAAIPSAIYSALLAGGYPTPPLFLSIPRLFPHPTPPPALPRSHRPPPTS